MKNDLPYFTHDNNAHRHPKMKALMAEYGATGYGMFWILNEKIAESSGAFIDITKKVNKLDLAQELGLTGDKFEEFLKFLSDPEIDLINYENGIITTDRTTEDYEKTISRRKKERDKKLKTDNDSNSPGENEDFPGENEDFPRENGDFPDNSQGKNIQNRTEENRDEQNRTNSQKPTGLLGREPKNDQERVNKKWIENYLAIYGNEPINPRWDLSSPLVKRAIKQAGVEKVLAALDVARSDEFCLKAGYILKVIMSGNVISRLINVRPKGTSPPPDLKDKKSLKGLSSTFSQGGEI
jgi:hypothetical protein